MATPTNIQLITPRPEHFQEMGWETYVDLYDALHELDKYPEIGFDLETTGLGSFVKEKINAMQLSRPGIQYVIDYPHLTDEEKKEVKKLLESKLLIGHNLVFDIPYAYKEGFQIRNIFDTMWTENKLMQGLDYKQDRKKDLASVTYRYLGIELDKSFQGEIAGGLTSVEAITYSGIDVRDLHAIKQCQIDLAARRQLDVSIKFENTFIPALCYWEFSGVKIDKEGLVKWIRNVEADEVISERHMNSTYREINWNSPMQVAEVLKEYGIEHIKEDTGKPETGDEILSKYDIPIAKDLMGHRSAAKLTSTYGRKWLYFLQEDGMIHTKYKPSVDTGRTSSGGQSKTKLDLFDPDWECEQPFPNLQNVVDDNRFRGIFIPRSGHVFVDADYSSQEVVIMADQSEDRKMMEFIREGRDMHSTLVRMIYPKCKNLTDEEIQKDFGKERTQAKRGSFAIAYGGNGNTIANNLNIPLELGNKIFETYMSLYTSLPNYFDKCYDFAWKNGYMPTDPLTGGKRFFDRAKEYYDQKTNKTFWDKYKREKEKGSGWYDQKKEDLRWYFAMTSTLKRESVNTRIQGTAAVMTKLANIYFMNWIYDNNMFGKVDISLCVHDSLTASCHKKSADRVAEALKNAMESAGAKCLKNLSISATPKICDKWQK